MKRAQQAKTQDEISMDWQKTQNTRFFQTFNHNSESWSVNLVNKQTWLAFIWASWADSISFIVFIR